MFDLRNQPARVFTPLAAVVLGVTVLIPACSQAPPFQPKSTVGQLMHDVVYPHAHEVWKSVGTIVTEEGTEEIRPRTDIEWGNRPQRRTHADGSGQSVNDDRPRKDNDKWMEHCQELIEAAAAVLESSEAYDADAVFDRGELIYNACQGCHWEYRYEDDPSIIRTR